MRIRSDRCGRSWHGFENDEEGAGSAGIWSLDTSPCSTESAFSTGTPSNLFPVNLKATDGSRYLITADGKRILANELAPTDLNKVGAMIIQNWTVALKR